MNFTDLKNLFVKDSTNALINSNSMLNPDYEGHIYYGHSSNITVTSTGNQSVVIGSPNTGYIKNVNMNNFYTTSDSTEVRLKALKLMKEFEMLIEEAKSKLENLKEQRNGRR